MNIQISFKTKKTESDKQSVFFNQFSFFVLGLRPTQINSYLH